METRNVCASCGPRRCLLFLTFTQCLQPAVAATVQTLPRHRQQCLPPPPLSDRNLFCFVGLLPTPLVSGPASLLWYLSEHSDGAYVSVNVCVYCVILCMCVCIYVCVQACMLMFVYMLCVCTRTYVYVCMYACMYLCMYVCINLCITRVGM